MGGTVSLEQLAHDSLSKSENSGWKDAVTRFNEKVPLDPSPESFPTIKVSPKTYDLMMSQLDKEVTGKNGEFLIPMLMVTQRLLSMESFYKCLRTPIPKSLIVLLTNETQSQHLKNARPYVLDVILRILISRVKFNVTGCYKSVLNPSEEAVVLRLENQAKDGLLEVGVFPALSTLLVSLQAPLDNVSSSNVEKIDYEMISNCLYAMHCSLIERSATTNYHFAKSIVDECLKPEVLNAILKLSIVRIPSVRRHAVLLLKGIMLHSPRPVIMRIQDSVLRSGYLLWYIYFCVDKKAMAEEHVAWNDKEAMECFRDLLGYLVDGHKDASNVLYHTLPHDLTALALQKPPGFTEVSPLKITEYYTLELPRADLNIVSSLGWTLYRDNKLQRSYWSYVFAQASLDHEEPTLIWDQYTREELVDTLVLEIEELKLQRTLAQGNGKDREVFNDASHSWDHSGYSVQYESLNRHLRVQDYYVHLLLPILENACENTIKKELIKRKSLTLENTNTSRKNRMKAEKAEKAKAKATLSTQNSPASAQPRSPSGGRNSPNQAGPLPVDVDMTTSMDDVHTEIEMTATRQSYNARTSRTSSGIQLNYNIPAEKLSGLVFACFQKAVIEDDVGWKLGCLRLMSALFETHKEILQDADMIPYLIWLLAPKPTVDGTLPEDVIRFLEKFSGKDASGGPMDEVTMQQIQRIAINNPLWRDHILRFLDQLFTYNSNINRFVKSDGISTLIYYINQIHLVNDFATSQSPRARALRAKYNVDGGTNGERGTTFTFNSSPAPSPTSISSPNKSTSSGSRHNRGASSARASMLSSTSSNISKGRIIHQKSGAVELKHIFDVEAIRRRQIAIAALPRDNMLENVHGPEDNVAVARRALRLLSKIVMNAPRLRRGVFKDSLRTALVQLMLCDDDVIISEALLVLDHLLEANTHAIPDLAGTGFFLFGLYAMRHRSMSCMGVFMDRYHLVQSTQYAPPNKTVLAPYFPQPMVNIIEERSVTEAFKLLDGESFTPTLIWNHHTRKALFDAVSEQTRLFLFSLCEEPSLAYTYETPSTITYPTIEKEMYVGGIYVRLFNANPAITLTDAAGYMKALVDEMMNEKYAYLFEECDEESTSIPVVSAPTPVAHNSMQKLAIPPPVTRAPQPSLHGASTRFSISTTTGMTANPPIPLVSPSVKASATKVSETAIVERPLNSGSVADKANQYLNVLNSRSRLAERFDRQAFTTIDKQTSAKVRRHMDAVKAKPSNLSAPVSSTGSGAPSSIKSVSFSAGPPEAAGPKQRGVRMSVMGDADVNEIMRMDETMLMTYNLMLLMRAQHIMIRKIDDFEVVKRYGAIQQLLAILATSREPFTHENDLFRLGIRLLRCVLMVPNSPNARVCAQKGGVPLVVRLITELGANVHTDLLKLNTVDAHQLASIDSEVENEKNTNGAPIVPNRPVKGESIETHALRENIDLLAQLFMSLSIMLKVNLPINAMSSTGLTQIDESTADVDEAKLGSSTGLNLSGPASPSNNTGTPSLTTAADRLCADTDAISSLMPFITVALRLNVAIASPSLATAVLGMISTLLRNTPRVVSYIMKHGILLDALDLTINYDIATPGSSDRKPVPDSPRGTGNNPTRSNPNSVNSTSAALSTNIAPTPPTYSRTAVMNNFNVNVRPGAVSLLSALVDRTRGLDPFYACFRQIVSQCLSPGLLQEIYAGYEPFITAITSESQTPTLIWGSVLRKELGSFLLTEIAERNSARSVIWAWGAKAHNICAQQASTPEGMESSVLELPSFHFTISPQLRYSVVKDVYLQMYKSTNETYSLPSYIDPQSFFDELCIHSAKLCKTIPTDENDAASLAEFNVNLMLAASSICQLVRAHPELVPPSLENPYSELRRLIALLMSGDVSQETALLQIFSKLVDDVRMQWQASTLGNTGSSHPPVAPQNLHKIVLFAAHDLHYVLNRKRQFCTDGPGISLVLTLIDTLVTIEVMSGRMALLQRFWENGLLASLVHIIANPYPTSPSSSNTVSTSNTPAGPRGSPSASFARNGTLSTMTTTRERVQSAQAHSAAVARVSMAHKSTKTFSTMHIETPSFPMPAFSKDLRTQAAVLLGRLCTLGNAGDYFMGSTKALFTPQFASELLCAQVQPEALLQRFGTDSEEPEFYWNESCRKDLRDFVAEEVREMTTHHHTVTQEYSTNVFHLRLEDEGYAPDEVNETTKNLPVQFEMMLIGDTEHYPRYPLDPSTWLDRFQKKTLSSQTFVDGVYVNVLHRTPGYIFKSVDIRQFYRSLLGAIKAEMEVYMWINFTIDEALELIENASAHDLNSTSGSHIYSVSKSASASHSIALSANANAAATNATAGLSVSILDEESTSGGYEDEEPNEIPTEDDLLKLYIHAAGSYEKLVVLLETLESLSNSDRSLVTDYMSGDMLTVFADFVRCESVIENNPETLDEPSDLVCQYARFLSDGNKMTKVALRVILLAARSTRADDIVKHRICRYLVPLLFTYFDFTPNTNEVILQTVLTIFNSTFENTKAVGVMSDQLHSIAAALFLLSLMFQNDLASQDTRLLAARVVGYMCSPCDNGEGVESCVHFMRFLTLDFERALSEASFKPENLLAKIDGTHICVKSSRTWNENMKLRVLSEVIHPSFLVEGTEKDLIPSILDWDLGAGRVFDIQSISTVWTNDGDDLFAKYLADIKNIRKQKAANVIESLPEIDVPSEFQDKVTKDQKSYRNSFRGSRNISGDIFVPESPSGASNL